VLQQRGQQSALRKRRGGSRNVVFSVFHKHPRFDTASDDSRIGL